MRSVARHPVSATLLIAAIVAGCTGGVNGVGVSPRVHTSRTAPGPIATASGTSATNNGSAGNSGASIENLAGNLVGHVVVPSELISDKGLGLVGNNGAGIVSNNGSSLVGNNGAGLVAQTNAFHVLTTATEVPAAQVQVRLLDAAGNPIDGPDGKPLVSTTDAQGGYSFQTTLPAHNLVIAVALADNKGTVQAIVPRDGSGQKVVDVDLVSTLTTSYILDQYVHPQKDPITTLDRLPADVEKQTRAVAAEAVDKASYAPQQLQTTDAVQEVTTLRKQDSTLDDQMTVVQKLLVVAGASDLGTGLAATDVTISNVDDLAFTPDGTMYLLATQDNRVWRLKTDGSLETAVGDRSTPTDQDLTGKLATKAGLDHPTHLAVDPAGHLLFSDKTGVYRLETDGTLTRLTTLVPLCYAAGQNDDVVAAVQETVPAATGTPDPDTGELPQPMFPYQAYAFYRCKPGASPQRLAEQMLDPNDDGETTVFLHDLAWDGGNACYVSELASNQATIMKLDLTNDQYTAATGVASATSYYLDTAGKLLAADAQGVLHTSGLLGSVAAETIPAPPQWTSTVRLAPDGHAYAAKFGAVYRLDAGGPVRVAGTDGEATTGTANTFTFSVLGGSTVTPSGGVYAIDTGNGAIYQVDAQQNIKHVANTGGGNVQLLRSDPAGTLYMSDGNGANIGRFDENDVWTAVQAFQPLILDFAVASDGTIYAVDWSTTDRQVRVQRAQNGVLTTLDTGTVGEVVALDAAGTPWVAGGGTLRHYVGGAWQTVKTDDHFTFSRPIFTYAGMAIDARGRLYIAEPDPSRIFRFDPTAGTFEDIAGAGTSHFGGSGTDNSLNGPCTPAFDKAGDLIFADTGNRQVKRIAASDL
ncbi:MAG TPA: hypothetical protein V6D47_21240 [Oscillatoriaceae cyanobacterium]